MKFRVEFEVPTFRNGWRRYGAEVTSVNRWKAIEKLKREFPQARVIKCERVERVKLYE